MEPPGGTNWRATDWSMSPVFGSRFRTMPCAASPFFFFLFLEGICKERISRFFCEKCRANDSRFSRAIFVSA